jgi:hypothetical protein
MRRLIVIGLAGALALASGASSAQADRFIGVELEVSGQVTVDFHGDEATGCASRGVCDVTGSVTWRPGHPAFLGLTESRRGRVIRAELGWSPTAGDPPATYAQVAQGAARCADLHVFEFLAVGLTHRRRSVAIGLPARNGLLATRCAAPLDVDVLPLLPRRQVTVDELRGRPRTIDLSADRPFAAAGLAGTVRSDLVLRTGRVEDDTDVPAESPRYRQVTATYRVERVDGTIHTGFAGLADPRLCEPFAACGLVGGVTWRPQVSSGRALLTATGSARRPWAALRAALGLTPGRRARGIEAYGRVDWARDPGTVGALISGGDGGCSDSASPPPALVLLTFTRRRVEARLASLDADPFRTRCPGPFSDDVDPGWVATGTLPASAFRRRRVELHLRAGHGFEASGYRGRTSADVTVVLRRQSVRQRTTSEPY